MRKKLIMAPYMAMREAMDNEWKCDTCKKTFTKKQMVWREDKKGKKTNRWCCACYFKK